MPRRPRRQCACPMCGKVCGRLHRAIEHLEDYSHNELDWADRFGPIAMGVDGADGGGGGGGEAAAAAAAPDDGIPPPSTRVERSTATRIKCPAKLAIWNRLRRSPGFNDDLRNACSSVGGAPAEICLLTDAVNQARADLLGNGVVILPSFMLDCILYG